MNTPSTDKMRSLTARWLEGLTTPAEERELLQMLDAADELPVDLAEQRELMHVLRDATPEAELPAQRAAELSEFVSGLAAAERMRSGQSRRRRRWPRAVAAVVAGLVVCGAGLGVAVQYNKSAMHLAVADTASVSLDIEGMAVPAQMASEDKAPAVRDAQEAAAQRADNQAEAAAKAAAMERETQQRIADRGISEAQKVMDNMQMSLSSTSRSLEDVSMKLSRDNKDKGADGGTTQEGAENANAKEYNSL